MGNYETIRAGDYVIKSESLDEKVAKLEERVEELEKKNDIKSRSVEIKVDGKLISNLIYPFVTHQ